ncbi:hypothetical protein LTR85_008259 [Meristemomyces frigidus]|nr:hypothetical protein LTR85_008259 [Meristemomyces frigidus]
MFLDGWIQYFDISNGHRIVELVASDPFAIFGVILLITMIPIALITLTVTARRSVYSIIDGIHYDARYRRLRRSARTSLLPTTSRPGWSHRSNRATAGTRHVSFALAMIPETPTTPDTAESSPMLQSSAFDYHARPMGPRPESPTGSTFEDVYDRWREARRPPRVDVKLENEEAKRRWTNETQTDLRMSAFEASITH